MAYRDAPIRIGSTGYAEVLDKFLMSDLLPTIFKNKQDSLRTASSNYENDLTTMKWMVENVNEFRNDPAYLQIFKNYASDPYNFKSGAGYNRLGKIVSDMVDSTFIKMGAAQQTFDNWDSSEYNIDSFFDFYADVNNRRPETLQNFIGGKITELDKISSLIQYMPYFGEGQYENISTEISDITNTWQKYMEHAKDGEITDVEWMMANDAGFEEAYKAKEKELHGQLAEHILTGKDIPNVEWENTLDNYKEQESVLEEGIKTLVLNFQDTFNSSISNNQTVAQALANLESYNILKQNNMKDGTMQLTAENPDARKYGYSNIVFTGESLYSPNFDEVAEIMDKHLGEEKFVPLLENIRSYQDEYNNIIKLKLDHHLTKEGGGYASRNLNSDEIANLADLVMHHRTRGDDLGIIRNIIQKKLNEKADNNISADDLLSLPFTDEADKRQVSFEPDTYINQNIIRRDFNSQKVAGNIPINMSFMEFSNLWNYNRLPEAEETYSSGDVELTQNDYIQQFTDLTQEDKKYYGTPQKYAQVMLGEDFQGDYNTIKYDSLGNIIGQAQIDETEGMKQANLEAANKNFSPLADTTINVGEIQDSLNLSQGEADSIATILSSGNVVAPQDTTKLLNETGLTPSTFVKGQEILIEQFKNSGQSIERFLMEYPDIKDGLSKNQAFEILKGLKIASIDTSLVDTTFKTNLPYQQTSVDSSITSQYKEQYLNKEVVDAQGNTHTVKRVFQGDDGQFKFYSKETGNVPMDITQVKLKEEKVASEGGGMSFDNFINSLNFNQGANTLTKASKNELRKTFGGGRVLRNLLGAINDWKSSMGTDKEQEEYQNLQQIYIGATGNE